MIGNNEGMTRIRMLNLPNLRLIVSVISASSVVKNSFAA